MELARIVSEDGGFSGSRAETPRRAEPSRQAPQSASRQSAAGSQSVEGLEAELLQELETSFSAREAPARETSRHPHDPFARGEAPGPVQRDPLDDFLGESAREAPLAFPSRGSSVRAALPVEQQFERDADELLRSIEEQLGRFERRQDTRSPAAPTQRSEAPQARPSWDEPAAAEPRWEEPTPAQRAAWDAPAQRSEWNEPATPQRNGRLDPDSFVFATSEQPPAPAPDVAAAFAEDQPAEPSWPASGDSARSDYRFRGPATADWDRILGTTTPAPDEPAPRPVAPAADAGRSRAFDAAPNRPSPRTPFRKGAMRDIFGDDEADQPAVSPFARRDETPAPRDDFFPEFTEAPAPKTAAVHGWDSPAPSPVPPLEPIAANPPITADRWDEAAAQPVDNARMAAATATVPARRAAAARNAAAAKRINRRFGLTTAVAVLGVILIGGAAAYYLRSTESAPAGPPPVIAAPEGPVKVEAEQQAAGQGETVGEAVYNRVAGDAPAGNEQIVEGAEEPREIARVVLPQTSDASADQVVRPVGGDAADDSAATDAAPRQVQTFVIRSDGSMAPTSDAPAATAPAEPQIAAVETQAIDPVPVATVPIGDGSPGSDQAAPPVEAPGAPAAAPDLAPTLADEPAPVAEAPAEVAVAAPPAPAPVAGDGYVVQLSSQRSMEQAQSSYADFQQRYPSVLGTLRPDIQEADLGAKGIYFRVRVGPYASRADAVEVCEALKGAGGTCFVTQ